MNERQLRALADLHFEGDIERAKKWVEENPDEVNRQIDQRGLVTRATSTGPSTGSGQHSGQATSDDGKEAAPEFELTDEAIQIIVTRAVESDVIQAQQTKLTEQDQTITTLTEKLTSVETVLAQVERRLKEVEATDQDKRRQMVQDLPANAVIPKLTYRPSVERGNEQKPVPVSSEVANKTLDGAGLTY
jgi:uncharacterized coiled-coil protein SlyX